MLQWEVLEPVVDIVPKSFILIPFNSTRQARTTMTLTPEVELKELKRSILVSIDLSHLREFVDDSSKSRPKSKIEVIDVIEVARARLLLY